MCDFFFEVNQVDEALECYIDIEALHETNNIIMIVLILMVLSIGMNNIRGGRLNAMKNNLKKCLTFLSIRV